MTFLYRFLFSVPLAPSAAVLSRPRCPIPSTHQYILPPPANLRGFPAGVTRVGIDPSASGDNKRFLRPFIIFMASCSTIILSFCVWLFISPPLICLLNYPLTCLHVSHTSFITSFPSSIMPALCVCVEREVCMKAGVKECWMQCICSGMYECMHVYVNNKPQIPALALCLTKQKCPAFISCKTNPCQI